MYNIAITGVGGGVGQSILKSLTNTDYNLIALDGELLGAGLYTTETAYLIPYANDSNYINKLLEICKNEKIALYCKIPKSLVYSVYFRGTDDFVMMVIKLRV